MLLRGVPMKIVVGTPLNSIQCTSTAPAVTHHQQVQMSLTDCTRQSAIGMQAGRQAAENSSTLFNMLRTASKSDYILDAIVIHPVCCMQVWKQPPRQLLRGASPPSSTCPSTAGPPPPAPSCFAPSSLQLRHVVSCLAIKCCSSQLKQQQRLLQKERVQFL